MIYYDNIYREIRQKYRLFTEGCRFTRIKYQSTRQNYCVKYKILKKLFSF